MNSKVIGDISESCVIAALLKSGMNVLIPFGDRNRYDVVVEHGGAFERIQIKTGREVNGALIFNTCSSTRLNGNRVETVYKGQIEKFAVYHRESDSVYLIPSGICEGMKKSIRLKAPKIKQPGIRYASEFLLDV